MQVRSASFSNLKFFIFGRPNYTCQNLTPTGLVTAVPDRPVQHIISASAFLRIIIIIIRAAASLQMPAKIHLSCRSLWQSLGCPLFCSFSFEWRSAKICVCNIHVAFQYSIRYTHGRTCFARPSAQERPCIQKAANAGNVYKI